MREQGGMEMGVEEREEWSSETCVYRPDDQTARSSSTAPVPQLSIWNSRMRIFMYAEVLFQRQRGWEKLISVCASPKSRDGATEKAQTGNKIKLSRRTSSCQTKKTEMQMFFIKPKRSAEIFSKCDLTFDPVTEETRQGLYFPLRISLKIRYITNLTQTPMCVDNISSNLMFWYSLATWEFSLYFSDGFLLEMPFIDVTTKVQLAEKSWATKKWSKFEDSAPSVSVSSVANHTSACFHQFSESCCGFI